MQGVTTQLTAEATDEGVTTQLTAPTKFASFMSTTKCRFVAVCNARRCRHSSSH